MSPQTWAAAASAPTQHAAACARHTVTGALTGCTFDSSTKISFTCAHGDAIVCTSAFYAHAIAPQVRGATHIFTESLEFLLLQALALLHLLDPATAGAAAAKGDSACKMQMQQLTIRPDSAPWLRPLLGCYPPFQVLWFRAGIQGFGYLIKTPHVESLPLRCTSVTLPTGAPVCMLTHTLHDTHEGACMTGGVPACMLTHNLHDTQAGACIISGELRRQKRVHAHLPQASCQAVRAGTPRL